MAKNYLDFSEMKWSDLEELEKAIHFEKECRKEKRFNELATAAANALTALKLEYPYVELSFAVDCEDCGTENDVNLFDHFDSFGPGCFCMG